MMHGQKNIKFLKQIFEKNFQKTFFMKSVQ